MYVLFSNLIFGNSSLLKKSLHCTVHYVPACHTQIIFQRLHILMIIVDSACTCRSSLYILLHNKKIINTIKKYHLL